MSRLFPILDKVIIRPDRDIGEKTSDGGIVLPTTRHEGGMTTGIIMAVGPDVKHSDIKAGNRAYFNPKFCGQEMVLGDKSTVLIMKEEDVLGVEEAPQHEKNDA